MRLAWTGVALVFLAACRPPALEWKPEAPPAACEVRVGSGPLSQSIRHYDERGRIVSGSRSTRGGMKSERFTYDDAGRLVEILSYAEQEAYVGPCPGCGQRPTRTIERVTLTYDTSGRLVRQRHRKDTYTRRSGEYEHSRRTRQERSYEYQPVPRRPSRKTPERLVRVRTPGLVLSYDYDERGRVVRILSNRAGGRARTLEVTYDEEGRVASRTSGQRSRHFHYDREGRLIRRDVRGWPREAERYRTWTYGPDGRVTRHRRVAVYASTGRRVEREQEIHYDDFGRIDAIFWDGTPHLRFRYAGTCDAVDLRPPSPSPLGPDVCVRSPHGFLNTCRWW